VSIILHKTVIIKKREIDQLPEDQENQEEKIKYHISKFTVDQWHLKI
jgi:hypothetical protein